MKVCFVVPDGVGIRNYLLSPLISELKKAGASISIWHRLDKKVLEDVQQRHEVELECLALEYSPESSLFRIIKEASVYSRLKNNAALDQNPATLLDWANRSKSFKRRALFRIATQLSRFFDSQESIRWAENAHYLSLRKTQAFQNSLQTLQKSKPDLIFCTHQRSPEAAIAIEAAKYLGIPTFGVIYSWDNLPKARLMVRTDHYLVWSDYMKQEFLKYYPEISPESIHVTGTPQFDFYKESTSYSSRIDFARENKLDPQKKWVCFSGDDYATSPFDEYYLRDIAETLRPISDVQLLFRPVPVSDHSRYQEVLNDYPEIQVLSPLWSTSENWSYSYPKMEDVAMLTNLVRHCATVLNVGSTMALDFACFDKPALYLNYLPEGGDGEQWTPSKIYNRQHFRSMGSLQPVGWVNSKEEIASLINQSIEQPDQVGPDRLQWLAIIRKEDSVYSSSIQISNLITSSI